MTKEMRIAINEQRAKLKKVISFQTFATDEDAIRAYNLAIKSYLNGMYTAYNLTLIELAKEGAKGE